MSSSVGLFPAEVVEVIFGRLVVSLVRWKVQPSSILMSSGRFHIGSLFRRSLKIGMLVITNDRNSVSFFMHWDFLIWFAFDLG